MSAPAVCNGLRMNLTIFDARVKCTVNTYPSTRACI